MTSDGVTAGLPRAATAEGQAGLDAIASGPAVALIASDYDGTLAQGVEALFYDTWAHGDDIRAALGMASVTESPGLRAALHHLALVLAQQGWGPATLALDGVEEIEIAAPADGAAGGAGAGHRITGDPLAFVLVASGRAEPAALGLDETVNVYR